ncbi:MAG TPA: DUF4332 domain-containing protein [Gammaproteobacteria bacterium]|nr:DUF4332 domain-containing protein [Gammaproteobacteria bacterium]
MGYLIGQIVLCLLIAFVLGFIIGCLFCRCKRAETVDDTDWESRYARLKRDHAQLRSESEDWKSKYTALAVAPRSQAETEDWAGRFEQLKQDYDHLKNEQQGLQQECEQWKSKYDALLAAKGSSQVTTHEYREGLIGDDYPYPVEEVEGIGKGFGKKLRALGIETTEDLLQRCCTKDGWEGVADNIGLKERYVVRKWASMADLMRIPGIMGQFAELLEFSGVESVQDLAGREPSQLLVKLKDVNEREHRVKEVPELDVVNSWILSAKSLDAVMKI